VTLTVLVAGERVEALLELGHEPRGDVRRRQIGEVGPRGCDVSGGGTAVLRVEGDLDVRQVVVKRARGLRRDQAGSATAGGEQRGRGERGAGER
jgi:hypothetical protein